MPKTNCELHHCDILIEAIDFFSQSLHLDQLISYGFELVNKALMFKASALYILENETYELKHHYFYENPQKCIKKTTQLNAIATLYGRILTGDYDKYFDLKDVSPFSPDAIIPIIVKDELVGFFIAQYSENKVYGQAELSLAFAVNQLMNKAYENAKSFKTLEEKNFLLDKKIFNLFFINHCSRTLLSELQINNIYQLCIDIIRELTASAVTSFFIHEKTTNHLILKGYKNILDFSQYYCEFSLKAFNTSELKVVYHVQRDRQLLEALFEDVSEFERLNAEYVILIVKEKVVGMVTISKAVSDQEYDATLFELIESIVTSIYISLTNALYFDEINAQKVIIQKKFETLTALNRAIRNINQCVEPDELFEVTLNTLRWGFNVSTAVIIGAVEDGFKIISSTDEKWKNGLVSIPEDTQRRIGKQVFFNHNVDLLQDLIPDLSELVELGGNCVVIAPIVLDKITLKSDYHVMGYIIVTELKDSLQEEEVILVDSIANSIAPVLDHMIERRIIEEQHVPNYEKLFLEALTEEVISKNTYEYSVFVHIKCVGNIPFMGKIQRTIEGSYIVNGYELYILDHEILIDSFDHVMEVESVDQFVEAFQTWIQNK